MPLIFSLLFIAIVLLVFGIGYAVLIYYRPFAPGWTWASVVIGDAFTDVGTSVALMVTLAALGLLDLWWLALYPFAAHLLTGLPMIIFQNKKRLDQARRNGKIEKELN